MTRHLQPVDDSSRGPWFLSTRAEIDAWAAERWATLSALMEAERRAARIFSSSLSSGGWRDAHLS